MITVTLSHPNGQRQDVILAGVPRVGEHIRLPNGGPTSPALIVEYVLWMGGHPDAPDPAVIIGVRSHQDGPDV